MSESQGLVALEVLDKLKKKIIHLIKSRNRDLVASNKTKLHSDEWRLLECYAV
jgi:hypothetical protein